MGIDGLGIGRRNGWQGERGYVGVHGRGGCVVETRRGPEWLGQREDNRIKRAEGIVSDSLIPPIASGSAIT